MKKVQLLTPALGAVLLAGLCWKEPLAHADGPLGNGDVNGDGAIDISDPVFLLFNLFASGPPPVPIVCPPPIECPPPSGNALPDTGQTKCYGNVEGQGWVEVPCAEAACPGQDGSYVTGCQSEGRFVDNGDGTVTDLCTGLMWQQDTADVNGDGQSTEQDSIDWCGALTYCENLDFAGHTDWRLPNVRELTSILDYGRGNPSVDPVFRALASTYWTSMSLVDDPTVAWYVTFGHGSMDVGGKIYYVYARAVRSVP